MTDSKRSTVLVVDDTPDNLLLINGILCDRYNVKVATNGATTLRIARSDNPPDLILLDITMPGMDGYEVCRQLKSDARTRDIPVIFLTARTEVEDEKRGLELGAADYITRPISPPIVMARVRTHLDLKAAADFLRDKNQFLKREAVKQEQFAKSTLDGQSAHICVINAQGEIITTNSAWDTFAVATNAASGTCCADSNYLDVLNISRVAVEEGQTDAEDFQAGLTAVFEGMLPRFVMEYECSSHEEVRWFLVRANPFVVADESYVVISHDDITARKQIEASLSENQKQLQSLNDQLEYRIAEEVGKNREKDSLLLHLDKMVSIGQLAAGVAHEINNPMGYVISNLASLNKYVDKLTTYLDANEHHFAGSESGTWEYITQERKKYKIDRIRQDLPELIAESREGAERVRLIVQDLKSFSRLNSSTGEFSDINKGLESTLTIAWNELKYKATVNREYGQLPLVWCNLGQLNQVFLNILVNAVHAIEGQGEIRIATRAAAESVKIAISDSGGGIAPENVKRIFDPFFTTKEVGKGTGLGLSIAYDIVVNKHGGGIDVTSQIGTGTMFTITLPVNSTGRQPTDILLAA